MDNFERPASDLCKGLCPIDPMTLKCTDGAATHCSRVNMESPLEFIGRFKRQEGVHKTAFEQNTRATTVSGVVRGWICGPSTIHTDILSISTATSTKGSDGKSYTNSSMLVDTGTITETGRNVPGPTNTTTNWGPMKPDDEDTYGCDREVDGECCTEDGCCAEDYYYTENGDVEWEEDELCARECAKKALQSSLPLNVRRRNAPSQLEDQEIMTKVDIITRMERPVETTAPVAAPGLTITEAILIACTKHTNQTSRPPLSKVTRTLDIVLPSGTETGTVTSSTHTRTTGIPRNDIAKTEEGDTSSSSKVVGAIVGSLLGALLLIAGLWCYFDHRRRERERRWRERRDSNPVSSRITANLSF